jgi:Arc/MetJ family transcription regulator
MRTTFAIDDALIRAVRRRAQEQGSTMSEVVDDALRQLFARPTRLERREAKLRAWGRSRKRDRIRGPRKD